MKPGRKYETLLVIITGLLVLWYLKSNTVLVYAALVIGLSAIIIPPVATAIDWCWYKIAAILGAVMSRVILGIFFFFILTPIALLKKLGKKDAMKLRVQNGSLWTERNHTFTAKDLENPW